ncbi:MAG: hypothetical protein RBT52_05980 [Sulfurimonas sp.]|jgi:hypothetical protein|nr:hypothetical protein [Sulfurimonas sp.]
MGKVVLSVILAIIIIFMSGCGAKAPRPMNMVETSIKGKIANVAVAGTINSDKDKASVLQNTAIQIKEAANIFKENGYSYFWISSNKKNNGIPLNITDMKGLVSYCYPQSKGFHADDTSAGSSSLEQKCNLELMKNQNTTFYELVPEEKPLHDKPTWSVDQVLADEFIEGFIKAAIEDGKYEDKELKFIKTYQKY